MKPFVEKQGIGRMLNNATVATIMGYIGFRDWGLGGFQIRV